MLVHHKELDHSGVMIPEVGFGTYRYRGGPDLIRKSIELGGSLIDTAELYENEDLVGEAIRGIRERVFVATKTHHWRYSDVLRSAETSLKRLGIERIDLYQIHWPNMTVPIAETMAAMEELVDKGLVRFIGVSNFSVPELKRAQAAMRKYRVVSNQMRYSIIERSIESEMLPYCQRNQITLIAYSPLGQGVQRILDSDPAGVLDQVARLVGKTKAQVALNWCIAKPGVVAIPKTESVAHLVENCASSGWRLTDEQIALLDKVVRFRRRSRLESALRRLARGTLQRLQALRRGG
jgi:diketogulonate reductase-like aldo/keto reductase